MALDSSSPSKAANNNVSLAEIIFSCTICQATVSEVYATKESNQGFHSGSGGEEGIVIKMWITECSHITCAKHLENGAAPFHGEAEAPCAPCPKCLREKGDSNPKNLFQIRGLGEGEYDSTIPSEWLRCPPIKLDAAIPGMAAIRFQYMALAYNAIETRKHWKGEVQKRAESGALCSKERQNCRELRSETQELKKRVEMLENAEAKLRQWEERKPMISHYLQAYETMIRDMEDMRRQLHDLGVEAPRRKYTFEQSQAVPENGVQATQTRQDNIPQTLRPNMPATAASGGYDVLSSIGKRKRDDDSYNPLDLRKRAPGRSSRDMMPPPLPKNTPQRHANGDHPRPISRRSMEARPYETQGSAIQHGRNAEPPPRDFYHEQRRMEESRTNLQYQQQLPRLPLSRPDSTRGEAVQFNKPLYPTINPRSDVHKYNTQRSTGAHVRMPQTLPTPQDSHHFEYSGSGQRYLPVIENTRARAPLQSGSGNYLEGRIPIRSQYDNSRLRESLQTPIRPQQGSVQSPFFSRDGKSHQSSAMLQHPNCTYSEGPGFEASTPYISSRRYVQTPHGRQTAFQNIQGSDPSLSKSMLRPSLRGPSADTNPLTQYQQPVSNPQIPRNQQGYFVRPIPPPSSATYNATPSRSFAHWSYSPQSSKNMHRDLARNSQDEMLARMPGVLGVKPRGGIPSSRQSHSVYAGGTNIFSSRGERRSVKR